MSEAATNKKTPIYKVLYFQVICAIVIGIVLGAVWPEVGEKMKPFGDGFIRLIKMIIAPVIFCTVVTGIAGMENMKKVGKTGGLALLYFEVVSTIALIIGLVIVNVVEPGSGMHVDPATLDQSAVSAYTGPGKMQTTTQFLMNVIPSTVVGAFAQGDILQVLFFSILFGFALHKFGGRGTLVFDLEVRTRSLPDRRHDHARCADRCIRRNGVHHWQVRHRIFAAACKAHGHLLRHVSALHFHCARRHLPHSRFLRHALHRLHQGGAPDRIGHIVIGIGASPHDDQDGKSRRFAFGRGAGDSDGLFLQP